MNWKNFFICGLTGWCMEILFTSFASLFHGDIRMTGNTSAWMFPIYGMAALIGPIYDRINHWPTVLRGIVYALVIMSGEFVSGMILKQFSACPWDYSDSLLNIGGVIRLDYLPFWVSAGLVFERLLCWQGAKKTAQ